MHPSHLPAISKLTTIQHWEVSIALDTSHLPKMATNNMYSLTTLIKRYVPFKP